MILMQIRIEILKTKNDDENKALSQIQCTRET